MGAPVGALVEALVGALALVGSRLVGAAWWEQLGGSSLVGAAWWKQLGGSIDGSTSGSLGGSIGGSIGIGG
jgi:hypothetical protein